MKKTREIAKVLLFTRGSLLLQEGLSLRRLLPKGSKNPKRPFFFEVKKLGFFVEPDLEREGVFLVPGAALY